MYNITTMQTFLPYPDFKKSLQVLDYRRLGKQRLEAKQILNVLQLRAANTKCAWQNHPAVLMWEGYDNALRHYHNLCIDEWIFRGYNNSMQHKSHVASYALPHWFGGKLHATHRSNLLRKNFDFYSKYQWAEPADLEYHWPVQNLCTI
jgi:hypothetical protein